MTLFVHTMPWMDGGDVLILPYFNQACWINRCLAEAKIVCVFCECGISYSYSIFMESTVKLAEFSWLRSSGGA